MRDAETLRGSSSATCARPSAASRCSTGVSLKVMPGESLVIIGGSGTGKSVTLKCILGILDRRTPARS